MIAGVAASHVLLNERIGTSFDEIRDRLYDMPNAAAVEVTRLERRVSFLATTASVTPFVGLFGTVWGIMTAFRAIGVTGSASLAIVAPGIAEALINTAAGLAAAIPAAVFYNLYSSRIRVLTALIDDFSMEFLNIVERNFT